MDQFQQAQTRAGWILCLSAGAISTFLSMMRAQNVWVAVMVISIVHIVFYYVYVSRPSQLGLKTQRDFLLMLNNRAVSVALVLSTFAVTMIGIAATGMTITGGHIGSLVALTLVCAILGNRYAATQWRTRSDLELTARNSTKLGMQFRSRYSFFLFASIGVACLGAMRYLTENVLAGLIATLSSAAAAHLLGYLVTKQLILLKLLPKETETFAAK